MKTIYLLRHAKSSWKDPDLADLDRPLNKRGKKSAAAMAAFMAEGRMTPDLVLCSAAKRTRSTLKKVHAELGGDIPAIVDEIYYHADAGEWLRHLRGLERNVKSVLLIGHNPALDNLAHRLAGGGDEDALERMAVKFPTGALAVFTADIRAWTELDPHGARLESFTCPRDLE